MSEAVTPGLLHFEVLTPGWLTTVQDVAGRPGLGRYGISQGGALDPLSAALANLAVGNPVQSAVLEVTLAGPTLRLLGGATVLALAGAETRARVNGLAIEPGWSVLLRGGSVVELEPTLRGVRSYLAVAGGFQVERILGSAATDLRGGFGGMDGRPLRAGDRLAVPPLAGIAQRAGRLTHVPAVLQTVQPDHPIRVLPGPHGDRFQPDAWNQLCTTEWRIQPGSDRMGLRLEGPGLRHRGSADVTSLGLPKGAVQVPGDGRPIVLLSDHQPTGGYAVLACVARADLPRLAQRGAGDPVRFVPTTHAEAIAALAEQRAALCQLESAAPRE